jgi:hypothetical protein|tara:strand:- start:25 stop:510 length:486 start_codon:yes stop_codon:yes gene_type:complete
MAFSRDSRFGDAENRLQETFYAHQRVPSPVDFQHVHTKGLIERAPLVSPNKMSTAGTTFGCAERPVLLDHNYTVQGKLGGTVFKHRPVASQSPRPGPGAHLVATRDNVGGTLWRTQRSIAEQDSVTIKSMINSLNFRLKVQEDEEVSYENCSKRSLLEVFE